MTRGSLSANTALSHADPHQAIQVGLPRRVEQPPASGKVGLEHGMKVARLQAIGITAHETRRDVQGAAERDAKMGKVAAHTGTLEQALVGRGLFIAAAALVVDVL